MWWQKVFACFAGKGAKSLGFASGSPNPLSSAGWQVNNRTICKMTNCSINSKKINYNHNQATVIVRYLYAKIVGKVFFVFIVLARLVLSMLIYRYCSCFHDSDFFLLEKSYLHQTSY